jgi:hypothetical protein
VKALLKNTLLGAAVFGSYEKIITLIDDNNNSNIKNNFDNNKEENPTSTDYLCLLKQDAYSRVSVLNHFGAGACSGSIHGLLTISLDSINYLYHQRNAIMLRKKNTSQLMKQKVYQSLPWSVSYTLHHSLAHAILFSSYEWTKRLLHSFEKDSNNYYNDKQSIIASSSSSTTTTITSIPTWFSYDVLAIFIAGGIAGQIQHIMSHLSEQILHVSDDGHHHHSSTTSSIMGNNNNNMEKQEKLITTRSSNSRYVRNYVFNSMQTIRTLTLPTFGSTMVAFLPSAVGFAAFEFGKDMMS